MKIGDKLALVKKRFGNLRVLRPACKDTGRSVLDITFADSPASREA